MKLPSYRQTQASLAYIRRKSATVKLENVCVCGVQGRRKRGAKTPPHKQIKRIDKMARVDAIEEECAVVIGYATREISYNYLVS